MRHRDEPAAPPTTQERVLRVAVVLAIVLLVALTFGPALVGQGVFADVSMLRRYWPFLADGRFPADAMACRSDTWDYYLPGIATIVEGARHGDWVTWAPYQVGGSPLASLPNHAALSPLSWPFWVMPLWLAPAFVKLTELVVVLVGTAAFLGRLGVRRSAGLLAGFVFFTCGFMLMWTGWPHTRVAALIPLLFWALDRVVVERRARDVAWVALVVASMLFGSFPAVTLFALASGAVYVVVVGLRQGSGRATLLGWVGAGAGVVLGAALSAVQILPFAANLGIALAGREPTDASPIQSLATTVAPGAWGTCAGGTWWGEVNPIEGIAFAGVGVVVLLAALLLLPARSGVRRGAVVLICVLLAAWCWLIWIGGAPLELLQQLPGFDTNKIGRGSSVFGFLVALAVGFAVDRLLTHAESGERVPRPSRRLAAGRVAVALAFVALVVAVAVGVQQAAIRSGEQDRVAEAFVVPSVLGVIAVVALLVALLGRRTARLVAVVVLVLVIAAQAIGFARQVWPLSDRDDFYPVTPTHEFLSDHLGHDRFGGGGRWAFSGLGHQYELRTPVGHEFTDLAWKQLLDTVSPDIRVTRTFRAFPPMSAAEVGSDPVLDQMAVRYWASAPGFVSGARRGVSQEPAGTPQVLDGSERASCTVPARALRGIEFTVTDAIPEAETGRVRAHVRLEHEGRVIDGVRAFDGPVPAGPNRVAVPAEDLQGPGTATVTVWFTGAGGPTALATAGDDVACTAIVPRPDGLRLVHADAGSVVYERTTALPRIRWAGRAEVVPSADERVLRLAGGVPADTVLLDEGTAVDSGSRAATDIVEDGAESIVVDVDASDEGHLVIADSIARDGWIATVDGRPADLVRVNHAFAGVRVPAGRHRVEVHYEAPGLKRGAIVTAVAAAVTLGLLVVRRRARPVADALEPDATD